MSLNATFPNTVKLPLTFASVETKSVVIVVLEMAGNVILLVTFSVSISAFATVRLP